MTQIDQLQRLEAEWVAVTRAREVIAIAEQAPSPKAAIPQIMAGFSLTEEQAVVVLDSQFRLITATAREELEEKIRALKA